MRCGQTGADMTTDDDLVIAARAPQRLPIIRMHAGQAMNRGVVGKGDGVHTERRDALQLSNGSGHVPYRHDGQRDESTRIPTAPFMDVPVVVGAYRCERQLLVL